MPCSESPLPELVARLGAALHGGGRMLATVESCTGGQLAQTLTAVAGSSEWFDRCWVTYSNRAKSEMVGVDAALIETHGAVSEPVVRAMVRGARARMAATDAVVAITGIAGPGGGSVDKPVGTVYLGWALGDAEFAERCTFSGDRGAVRGQAVRRAIEGLLELLDEAA